MQPRSCPVFLLGALLLLSVDAGADTVIKKSVDKLFACGITIKEYSNLNLVNAKGYYYGAQKSFSDCDAVRDKVLRNYCKREFSPESDSLKIHQSVLSVAPSGVGGVAVVTVNGFDTHICSSN